MSLWVSWIECHSCHLLLLLLLLLLSLLLSVIVEQPPEPRRCVFRKRGGWAIMGKSMQTWSLTLALSYVAKSVTSGQRVPRRCVVVVRISALATRINSWFQIEG